MHNPGPLVGAALFDLDGTLVQSEDSILGCLNAFASHEVRLIPTKQFARVFGIPLSEFLSAYFPPEELYLAVARFQELYLSDWISQVQLIPGATSVLQRLQEASMPVCIASANQHRVVQSILEATGLNVLVGAYQGIEAQTPGLASKSAVVACLLKSTNIKGKCAVLIGDTPSDAIAARRNGIPFWAVTYGHGERHALEELQPQYVFSEIDSVAKMLLTRSS